MWPWTWVATQVDRLIGALEKIVIVQQATYMDARKADRARQQAANEILDATTKLNAAVREHITECQTWQTRLTEQVNRALNPPDQEPKKTYDIH